MAESIACLIDVTAPSRLQITKWKVRKGYKVSQGAVLGFYQLVNPKNQDKTEQEELTSPNNNQLHKLKANHVGTVSEILAEEGKEIVEGSVVLQIKGCSHPTVMKDMCADCGADLRSEMGMSGYRKENVSATVAMVHSIPELIISEEQALELGRADEIRLKQTRRLVLLVDLDQTLIHTTNDNIPPNLKGIHHFQLWQGMNLLWYHTRIRPHTQQFLENISKLYELHICTFGVRMYAHTIARFIDPAGKFFSHRILSRDECFNAMSKTANLKALFPCGDSMVCIIDDREDVWNFAPNLIHVKPYRFFQGTADINAPPGLSKKENDSKLITRHVRKVSANSGSSVNSKDKYKASKDVEKETMEVEESGEQKTEEEDGNVARDLVTKDKDGNAASKEGDTILVGKEIADESVSPTGKKDAENLSVVSEDKDDNDASKEQDTILVGKEIADESVSPTGKKDAVNLSAVSKDKDDNAASKEQDISLVGKDDAASKEEDTILVGKEIADESVSPTGKKDAENLSVVSEDKDDNDASKEQDTILVGKDDAASKEEDIGLVGKDDADESVSSTGRKDAVNLSAVSKDKDDNAASKEQDTILVGKEIADESVSPTGKKDVENLSAVSKDKADDAASKEQDISLVRKEIADESVSPTGKKDAENLCDDLPKEAAIKTLHSKEEEEPKSDEEDGSKAEDMEGLSEDSSMSGMSLCDNSSKNATGKNDDSNVDENDDENNDDDNDDKMIEWEDNDDYLFYLEEILQRIHTTYFNISDRLSEGKSSQRDLNLKTLIPRVKRKVLKGCNICFSGVIPLNTPVVKCRAYNVALSLGANVHERFVPYSSKTKSNYTTHLIANKMGTSKVHAAQRARRVAIVSLDWLWSCSERWDHVDEKLFLLKEKRPLDSDTSRSSPELSKPGKSSSRKRKIDRVDRGLNRDDVFPPETKLKKIEDSESSEEELKDESLLDTEGNRDNKNKKNDDPKKLKRTGSHYNPLYSFSDEELASMDKELEELMDEDESDSDEKEAEAQLRKQILSERKCDTSSEDSLSGEFPHGWKSKKWPKRLSGKKKVSIKRDESLDGEDSEASISEKYEKSIEIFAAHVSDSSNDDSDCESIGSIDEEIAEAVEKEFLAR